jgi:hypothetical protein
VLVVIFHEMGRQSGEQQKVTHEKPTFTHRDPYRAALRGFTVAGAGRRQNLFDDSLAAYNKASALDPKHLRAKNTLGKRGLRRATRPKLWRNSASSKKYAVFCAWVGFTHKRGVRYGSVFGHAIALNNGQPELVIPAQQSGRHGSRATGRRQDLIKP